MSQQQAPRNSGQEGAIKYGDEFEVHGELASEAVAPGDAARLQSEENKVLGRTQRGGPAAVMQSAATANVRAGRVQPHDTSDVVQQQGVSVTRGNIGGTRLVTETVGGEVVAQYADTKAAPAGKSGRGITIGEALEGAALSAPDKPIDQADAAAIQAAEVRSIESDETPTGGLGAQAHSAASTNPRVMLDINKTTLSDVLADATKKLGLDKEVTSEDAEAVVTAEIRNKADMSTTPGGVASSMASAAQLNQMK